VVLACEGPKELIQVLQTSSYENLTWTVARVIKTLSVCQSNKKAIIECGGIQVLARHLDSGSKRLTEEVLWTLRNLSDSASRQDNLDSLIGKLMTILERTDVNFVICAVGCLSNLTCNNQHNKKLIHEGGGVETLLRALMRHYDRPPVSEPLLCTLRHINYKHADFEKTQHAFRVSGGIGMMGRLLAHADHWAVIKATCSLLCNLAINSGNLALFKEAGITQQLIQLIYRLLNMTKGSLTDVKDGIKLEDIILESLKTIQILAQDTEFILPYLKTKQSLQVMLKSLGSTSEDVVRASLNVLTVGAANPEFIMMLKKEGGADYVSKCLHSRDTTVCQNAATVYSKLSDASPEHIRHNSGNESAPSLMPADSIPTVPWSPRPEVTPLNDVVDLDASTAQFRENYVKSPPGNQMPPQFSPHHSYTPVQSPPTTNYSPHQMQQAQLSPQQPYTMTALQPAAFPTTYASPVTTHYQAQVTTGYGTVPVTTGFGAQGGGYPPNYQQSNFMPANRARFPAGGVVNRPWYGQ